MLMTIHVGFYGSTPIEVEVTRLKAGIGETDCWECEGTGDWSKYMPEPTNEPCPCVECKGTGRRLVGCY